MHAVLVYTPGSSNQWFVSKKLLVGVFRLDCDSVMPSAEGEQAKCCPFLTGFTACSGTFLNTGLGRGSWGNCDLLDLAPWTTQPFPNMGMSTVCMTLYSWAVFFLLLAPFYASFFLCEIFFIRWGLQGGVDIIFQDLVLLLHWHTDIVSPGVKPLGWEPVF